MRDAFNGLRFHVKMPSSNVLRLTWATRSLTLRHCSAGDLASEAFAVLILLRSVSHRCEEELIMLFWALLQML